MRARWLIVVSLLWLVCGVWLVRTLGYLGDTLQLSAPTELAVVVCLFAFTAIGPASLLSGVRERLRLTSGPEGVQRLVGRHGSLSVESAGELQGRTAFGKGDYRFALRLEGARVCDLGSDGWRSLVLLMVKVTPICAFGMVALWVATFPLQYVASYLLLTDYATGAVLLCGILWSVWASRIFRLWSRPFAGSLVVEETLPAGFANLLGGQASKSNWGPALATVLGVLLFFWPLVLVWVPHSRLFDAPRDWSALNTLNGVRAVFIVAVSWVYWLRPLARALVNAREICLAPQPSIRVDGAWRRILGSQCVGGRIRVDAEGLPVWVAPFGLSARLGSPEALVKVDELARMLRAAKEASGVSSAPASSATDAPTSRGK